MLLALAMAALQGAPVRVVTVDNAEIVGTAVRLVPGEAGLTARVQTADGERAVACDVVTEIALSPRVPEPAPQPDLARLELTSGDVLYGKFADPDGPEATLAFQTSLLGTQQIPFSRVRWFGRTAEVKGWPAEPPKDRGMAHVYLANGDRIEGVTLLAVTPANVQFKWNTRRLRPSIAEVAAVHFMAVGDPPAEGTTLTALLDLSDASRIRGRLERFDAEGAVLTDLYGVRHALRAEAVRHILFRNGRVVYLSDLEPAAVEENANYIRVAKPAPGDLDLPHRRDLNARGGPLSIGRRLFRKGIGVHAYSALTFTLDGRYERFLATVGLDDCAGAGAPTLPPDVLFEITADGAKVFSETLRARDGAREVNLDVSQVRQLKLVADFGAGGGGGDYADWAAARLIRKP
jgi:hypothetical protein